MVLLLFFPFDTIAGIVAQRPRAVKGYDLGGFRALPPDEERADAGFDGLRDGEKLAVGAEDAHPAGRALRVPKRVDLVPPRRLPMEEPPSGLHPDAHAGKISHGRLGRKEKRSRPPSLESVERDRLRHRERADCGSAKLGQMSTDAEGLAEVVR